MNNEDGNNVDDFIIGPFDGEFEWLSNFYPTLVDYEGVEYPTVEHAFQAAKTDDVSERETIGLAKSPGRAKRMGRRVALRPDWEEEKIGIMLKLVMNKFTRHKDLAEKLISTGDMRIVEINTWHDTFWGVCNGTGENHLGRILMEVRQELRRQYDK